MGGADGDTFDRSLAHWSEDGREEMEAFYAVATQDYRELAEAWDWAGWLTKRLEGQDEVRILDVACGSGKFPRALRRHTALGDLEGTPLVLDLLDPSAFSLEEAAASLAPPMRAGRRFEVKLQELDADAGPYDIVWATHALYALPEAELPAGAAVFRDAIAPDGLGFIAHATENAHYLRFYERYLRRRGGTPYASAAAVADAFRGAGAEVDARTITYRHVITDEGVLEGYLQRCLFDDTLDLEAMRADPELGPYLAEHTEGGRATFEQEVAMLFIRR